MSATGETQQRTKWSDRPTTNLGQAILYAAVFAYVIVVLALAIYANGGNDG